MNLKHLQHLIALAEERHFGRAAARVHLSQPAFSRSILALEQATNLQLFDRESGGVSLTPAGEFLLARAKTIQFAYHGLVHDVKRYAGAELGQLVFGMGPFPAAMLLQHLVIDLRQQAPHLQLKIEVHNWQMLMTQLKAEALEFFIADCQHFSKPDPDVDLHPLTTLAAGFFVHPKHPLANRSLKMQDLLPFGFATIRLPPEVRNQLGAALGLVSEQQLSVAVECDDVGLLKTVAQTTDTILGMVYGAVTTELAQGKLIPLTINDQPPLQSTLGLFSLAQRSLSPAAVSVINKLKIQLAVS
ncbi:LysR family transcriptional regulator [Arsukibacterium sp.]|uniref:LysR family transcriptional regulator n=1 Tax=Arsukibacterium sp. TaxID=1977258 RepID=UPI002FDB3E1F